MCGFLAGDQPIVFVKSFDKIFYPQKTLDVKFSRRLFIKCLTATSTVMVFSKESKAQMVAFWRRNVTERRFTQTYAEVLATRSSNASFTQTYAEVLTTQPSGSLFTQTYAEVLSTQPSNSYFTQTYAEVFSTQPSNSYFTQTYAEVIIQEV